MCLPATAFGQLHLEDEPTKRPPQGMANHITDNCLDKLTLLRSADCSALEGIVRWCQTKGWLRFTCKFHSNNYDFITCTEPTQLLPRQQYKHYTMQINANISLYYECYTCQQQLGVSAFAYAAHWIYTKNVEQQRSTRYPMRALSHAARTFLE